MTVDTGITVVGKFVNIEVFNLDFDCHSIMAMVRDMLNPHPSIAPKENIEVQKIDLRSIFSKSDSLTRITWLGHSSFFFEIDGKNILLDPVFGQYAAPHPLLGRKRYSREMPIEIEQLPQIDAIIISSALELPLRVSQKKNTTRSRTT